MNQRVFTTCLLYTALAVCLALLAGCWAQNESAQSTATPEPIAATSSLQTDATKPAEETNAQASTPPYNENFDGLVLDGEAANLAQKIKLSKMRANYTQNIVAEYQYPELPSGCELVSLNMALRAAGFELSKTEITDNYLVIDGNEWGYLASPYEEHGGGFPPGITDAANSYLQAQASILQAYNLTGSSFESLQALVNAGLPVLVWTTLDLSEPDHDPGLGGTETFFVNEHCVVLYGYTDETVLLANPLEGLTEAPLEQFEYIYEQCGSMALGIF